jgi:hypothetical protein
LLRAVERPTSIKEPFMAFAISPNRSNASITIADAHCFPEVARAQVERPAPR